MFLDHGGSEDCTPQTYLGKGAVVPEVTLVGEAVTDIAELALLDVLLDGIEGLFLGNL